MGAAQPEKHGPFRMGSGSLSRKRVLGETWGPCFLRQDIQGGNPQTRIPPALRSGTFRAIQPTDRNSRFFLGPSLGHPEPVHKPSRTRPGSHRCTDPEARDQGGADYFIAPFEDNRYLESSPGMPLLVLGLGQFPGVFDPAHFREHGRDFFSFDLP